MTKEEQWKREAEIKLDELDDRGFDFDNWSLSDAYERGYCDCAEPREKRIAELEKENVELKNELEEADNATDCFNKQEEIIAKAKEIMNIAIEGIKHWGIVGGTERPFEKQAEKLFNLFLDKAEQFLSEVDK